MFFGGLKVCLRRACNMAAEYADTVTGSSRFRRMSFVALLNVYLLSEVKSRRKKKLSDRTFTRITIPISIKRYDVVFFIVISDYALKFSAG